MGDPFGIFVPRWQEHPSGLVVPSSVADGIAAGAEFAVPDEFAPAVGPIAVYNRRPGFTDQIYTVPGATEIGLPDADLDDLRVLIADVPFEPAFLLLARMAAELWHAGTDSARQIAMVREIEMNGLADLLDVFVAGAGRGEQRVVFSPQDINIVQRLLIEVAADKTFDDGMEAQEAAWAVGAIFHAGEIVRAPVEAELVGLEVGSDEWLLHILQNGAFHSRRAPMNALTRARELFVDLAARLNHLEEYCPINDWFIADHGLSVDEQQVAGFALYGGAGALNDPAAPSLRSLIGADFFDRSALVAKRPEIETLLTADRAWYQAAFAEALAEADGDEETIAWERTPFWQRPLLRCSSGQWLLVTPHALDDWLGSGFYYRALECARARGVPLQFTQFFGRLVEEYALEMVGSVYPAGGPGRVHGEQVYDRGQQKTSDVAVDLGPDLVLFEVVSRRLTAAMLVGSDPLLMQQNLERMLYAKMRQLGRVITALLEGRATIPGVDPQQVERIWPVVVTAGELVHTDLLWERTEEKTPDELKQARVQSLAVLDLEELEVLCALVAEGHHIPEVLTRKAAGPYADLELLRFVAEELRQPNTLRPPIVVERWQEMTERAKQTLGFV
jgi:hypothetical protein